MSTVSAMKPNFSSRDAYRGWRDLYRMVYARLTEDIRRQKIAAKDAQRAGLSRAEQRALHFNRRTAYKMMTLLQDAKVRLDRINTMHRELDEQNALFPLDLGVCKNIDFHYNRGANEFGFLPLWVVRAKGRSYYVSDVVANAPWSTKERATGSTRGVIRFKKANVEIDAAGVATLNVS